jgi:AGZA family xanthine/uracil permease-like MFS transporter
MAMRIAPILAYDRARLATSTAVTPPRTGAPPAYRWAAPGDLNAFFGLMLDNVMNLVILAGILIGVFGFPRDLVYTKMFPGTALGVLFGDLVYTWMAFRLARREGRSDVTAMPLGLDAPSTIGMAFAVLGPAFLSAKTRMPEAEAGVFAWQVGMACMVLIGLFKLGMSFVGGAIQRVVPKAGLLGSIAGVGIALMGVLQLADILAEPVVGFVSLA